MQAHFDKIIAELEQRPLQVNRYRKQAGRGQSQTFGVVKRRCLLPDYSTLCWKRPYLYHLLLNFGNVFIKINWNSITINQNYQCSPHKDKNNSGESVLVAFGDYEGGELSIFEGEKKGVHDVKNKLFQCDFSQVLHHVLPFTGNRYSLVFYYTPVSFSKKTNETILPPPSVRLIDGKHVFYRGDSSDRLPHPLSSKSLAIYE